jgi:hypothetical protein
MPTMLRLVREPSDQGATLGALYINDVWVCWTLEDVIREPVEAATVAVASWKVPGQTAIPAGRYPVALTRSQRFGVVLPEIQHVPGFSGIRIHAGNTAADTEGCLLVGRGRGPARIAESRLALEDVLARLTHAVAPVWIDVENPPRRHFSAPMPRETRRA